MKISQPPLGLDMHQTDYLVVGGGVAGLYAALALAESAQVTLLTGSGAENALLRRQILPARVAASDMMASGVGLCPEDAVRGLEEEWPECYRELAVRGKDINGLALWSTFIRRCEDHPAICFWEGQALQLALSRESGRCRGVLAFDRARNAYFIHARSVILAEGGLSGLYRPEADPFAGVSGLVLAYQAGCSLVDMEFIYLENAGAYGLGGVETSPGGKTEITGVYACGEAAGHGVHGALCRPEYLLPAELVFARRAARSLADLKRSGEPSFSILELMQAKKQFHPGPDKGARDCEQMKLLMQTYAGAKRDWTGLKRAQAVLDQMRLTWSAQEDDSLERLTAERMWPLAAGVVGAALRREETRGLHRRADYPYPQATPPPRSRWNRSDGASVGEMEPT